MTGEVTLYPLVSDSLPLRSILLLFACVFLGYILWQVLRHQKTPASKKEMKTNVIGRKINQQKLIKQLVNLQQHIGKISSQERYREYQQILRTYVGKRLGIDIQSTSLKQIKFSYTAIPSKIIRLLDQTYYFPYNLEKGDEKIMKEETDLLMILLSQKI